MPHAESRPASAPALRTRQRTVRPRARRSPRARVVTPSTPHHRPPRVDHCLSQRAWGRGEAKFIPSLHRAAWKRRQRQIAIENKVCATRLCRSWTVHGCCETTGNVLQVGDLFSSQDHSRTCQCGCRVPAHRQGAPTCYPPHQTPQGGSFTTSTEAAKPSRAKKATPPPQRCAPAAFQRCYRATTAPTAPTAAWQSQTAASRTRCQPRRRNVSRRSTPRNRPVTPHV